jgi:catalase
MDSEKKKSPAPNSPVAAKPGQCPYHAMLRAASGETHQQATTPDTTLTTNQGIPVADNQNSMKAGVGGPTLLEDFILREKITHFDHERIPERIVHARGSAAHGIFESYGNAAQYSRAKFLQKGAKTEVFTRFSTVAGGAGSADVVRDVRGFSVKFYTEEGNFDLVGNNIPVFFIQDAMKFPDLIHAVKMEPDRAFPQAASAHDTFWDFASLMPESMHMLVWAMSDRGIPRSYRMIEGFGIHTFRLIDADDRSTFIKFHWKPLLGIASVVWDEAVKINGADPDFHRRDLYEAIAKGDYPEWELGFQIFDQATADGLDFDILDPTKLIPEEIIPVTRVGKMTLNRNPDNFFAETEQVAFCPANIVPGIAFSNDPLLQGRLFSYLDTQLSRLGGANFHQIPINAPRCPVANFQRDGIRQMNVPKGRVAYEPASLDQGTPRENPRAGWRPFSGAETTDGTKTHLRKESFADHYSQARQLFNSLTKTEQTHVISAFAFELAKVETKAIRQRMLGHLLIIDQTLGTAVADALGMEGQAEKIDAQIAPRDLAPSPALSILGNAPDTLKGRKVGVLITDGFDAALLKELQNGIAKSGASCAVIAPKVGGAKSSAGKHTEADHALSGAPSVFFDSVAILASDAGAKALSQEAGAKDWISDAFAHLKIIAHTPETLPLFKAAGIKPDDGVVSLTDKNSVSSYLGLAKRGRLWKREPKLRSPG